MFRAGRLWERVRRLVDIAEKNQEDIGDLQVEVKRLWIASAEGVELPDDLLPEADEEDEPVQQELTGGDEEEDDDAH